MKFILFCNLPYSFSILKPLEIEISKRGFDCIWYIPKDIENIFVSKGSNYTTNIKELISYQSDIIFVPGNEVPHYLRGLKVQIFHGLAGEKKGHFRIRDYFDLYLTSGPYFTRIFNKLALKYKNFDVVQTGWCKLDTLYTISEKTIVEKNNLLQKYKVKYIVLYSPTFSPSLTSGLKLLKTINNLSNNDDILVIAKFHDKMDKEIINQYKNIRKKNILISQEKDISKLLQISDLMISDTSSVVYEFILLDKPVLTLNNSSQNINWENTTNENEIYQKTIDILDNNDNYKVNRQNIIKEYHPYSDGKSSSRMINTSISHIQNNGVPNKRKLSFIRKLKIWKLYK